MTIVNQQDTCCSCTQWEEEKTLFLLQQMQLCAKWRYSLQRELLLARRIRHKCLPTDTRTGHRWEAI